MKTCLTVLKAVTATIALAAAFGSSAAQPQDQQRLDVADYAIYVDLPTAFAFVKLPQGWKFVGKLDVDQLRHLPTGTLTTLLTGESEGAREVMTTASAGAGTRQRERAIN